MKKALGLAAVLVVASTWVATPVMAQKVDIDYAHDFDFKGVKTFQYVDTEESNASNPLMAARIEEMIKERLRAGGLTEVQEDPDLLVTYHVMTAEWSSFNTTHFGYGGYHGGWYGWGGGYGMGTSTTTQQTYVDGTLIIDAWDGTEEKMVWRGRGTVTVKSKSEKQIKQIEKILGKLGKRWEKILAGMGK